MFSSMDKIRLKKHELAKITRIKARTLLDWTQRGYLEPQDKATGQGKTSFYSPANVVQAKVLERLSQTGVSLNKFSELFKAGPHSKLLLDHLDPFRPTKDRMYSLVVIDNCRKVVLSQYRVSLSNKAELPKEVHDGNYEMVLVINLRKIMLDVRKDLAKA